MCKKIIGLAGWLAAVTLLFSACGDSTPATLPTSASTSAGISPAAAGTTLASTVALLPATPGVATTAAVPASTISPAIVPSTPPAIASTVASSTTTLAGGITSSALSATGRFTGLPLYTPGRNINFIREFNVEMESTIRSIAGDRVAKAVYDGFITPDSKDKVVAYYDDAMKKLGYRRLTRLTAALDNLEVGMNVQVYIYINEANEKESKAIALVGPFTFTLADKLKDAVTTGNLNTNDVLVLVISGIAL